jgi:hypothetical protein
MQQSPSSEPNIRSVSQEIPRLLWNQKVHYHPVYTLTTYFFKIHFNIILTSTSRSSDH